MQWTDDGIVLGARAHGETGAILDVLTHAQGRHLGLVKGGRGRRLGPALQPGNSLRIVWRARLENHLGQFLIEPLTLRAGRLLGSAAALHGLGYLTALMRLLPEREPQPGLYQAVTIALDHLETPLVAAALIGRIELQLLGELGFGLDLESCAVTGATQELTHVSPRTGRAVSARAAAAYSDRLLKLPAFLRNGFVGEGLERDDLAASFALTGHFLTRHVLEPRGLPAPPARAAFIAAVASIADAGGE
jgi:DNA repair protein RecO (recombination protein O)